MMSRIDPIRRSELARRAARPDPETAEAAAEAEVVRLPVPVDRVTRIHPREEQADGHAVFAAQLLGQENQKRGLRAAPELAPVARSVYNRTEWSGSKDRRAAKGSTAKTEV